MRRLARPKRLFHQDEVLIPLMDHLRIGDGPWQVGLEHIAAVETGGLLLSRSVHGQAQCASFGLPREPPMDFQALELLLGFPEGH